MTEDQHPETEDPGQETDETPETPPVVEGTLEILPVIEREETPKMKT